MFISLICMTEAKTKKCRDNLGTVCFLENPAMSLLSLSRMGPRTSLRSSCAPTLRGSKEEREAVLYIVALN